MPHPVHPAEATQKLLAQLWQRSLPTLHSRITLFRAAADAAANGLLTPRLCEQAANEAHKLAGSLGMFGYPKGTAIARDLELLFETPAPPNPTSITTLTNKLEAELFPHPKPQP